MDDIDLQASPEMAMVHPGYTWHGLQLPLYNMSSKLLLQRITIDGDRYGFIAFCVVYILSHPKEEMRKLANNRDAFRNAVYDWADSLKLTDSEEGELIDLVDKILNDSKAGKAQIVDMGDTDSAGKV